MRRRGQRGFTLVELTVALAAGLIVALGIVGLSRDATRTFHEEMRSSAAEESLRTAVDRIRADLGRAGFMSTSDIVTDTAIARPPSGGALIPKTWGLAKLASIQIIPGKALTQTPLSVTNGLNPDAIWIGGDMTTSDLYSATLQPIGGAAIAAGNGCTPLYLTGTSPAMLRLIGKSTNAAKDLNNAFQPGPSGQFMVRVLDHAGHTQYLATCAGTPTSLPSVTQPVLFVAANPPFLQSQTSQGQAQISGFDVFWVNPVQIVQYQLVAAANEAVQYTTSPLGSMPLTPAATEDPTKYDLVRSYIDAVTGLEVPGTQEIIAEYAVDLAFSLTVDTGTALLPSPVSFPFDNANNALWAKDVSTLASPIVNDPKRIRAVRVRLVTRAGQADRTLSVPVPGTAGTFLYRYCVVAGGCDPVNATGIFQYARARTVTAEVSLPNQAGAYQ
jgi:prepilin-type N-terminal cleavage/methylation domain-containing protein